MDANKLKQLVKTFLEYEGAYSIAKQHLSEIQTMRNTSKNTILNYLKEVKYEKPLDMTTAEGVLSYRKSKSSGTLSRKLLATKVPEYFAANGITKDPKEFIDWIWEQRPSEETWDISLKPENDSEQ